MGFLFLYLCILNSAQYIYASKGAIHPHFGEMLLFPSITSYIYTYTVFVPNTVTEICCDIFYPHYTLENLLCCCQFFLVPILRNFFLADSSAKMFKNLCFVLRECHGYEKITRSLDHHLENGANST